jgi:O-antigen/teichoic acid export membrane protein
MNQGVVFLLLPLYAHLLGPAGVGVVEIMVVARAFMSVFFVQGLDSAWFRLRFDHPQEDDVRELESTIVWYVVATAAVGLTLLTASGEWVSAMLTPGVPFVPLGLLTACAAAASVFGMFVERKLQAEQQPIRFALFSLGRTVGTVSTIVVFVAWLRRGAPGKIEAEALAAVVSAVVALSFLRPRMRFSVTRLRRALGYGLPLVPHHLAGLVNALVDRFLLNAFLGLQAVGVYSMGARLAGVGMVVMVAVNQAFAPMFVKALKDVERSEASGDLDAAEQQRRDVASTAFVNVLVACVVAQIVTATGREVLELATTREFVDSWRVIAPISASVVAWGWYGTLSQSVAYRADTVRRMPIITIASAVSSYFLNRSLIPVYGMMGAALAALGAQMVMAALAFWFARRSLRLPHPWSRWVSISGWTALALAGFWILDSHQASFATRITFKAAWLALSLAATAVLAGMRVSTIRRLWESKRG